MAVQTFGDSKVLINGEEVCVRQWSFTTSGTYADTTNTCDEGFESEQLASKSVEVTVNAQLDLADNPFCEVDAGEEVALSIFADRDAGTATLVIPVATVRSSSMSAAAKDFVNWTFTAKSQGSYTLDCPAT